MFDTKSYEQDAFERNNDDRFAISYLPTPLNRETASLADGFKVVCAFVNDTVDAATAETLASRGVELLAMRCAGYNNADLDACRDHGVDVVRVPAYSPYAVAEHAVTLMLSLNRRIHIASERLRDGNFSLQGLVGFDMHGKTAVVAGTGKIGVCAINILRGFGCRVLAYDKFVNPEVAAMVGVEYVNEDRLLAESDIITLHMPLFPETRHFIDAESIAKMKEGVMLINKHQPWRPGRHRCAD